MPASPARRLHQVRRCRENESQPVIVHVTHPMREEEPAAAAAEGAVAEPTEPEVLKKGKAVSEEEGAEEAAPAKKEKEKEK